MSPTGSALLSLAAVALCSSCQPIEGNGLVVTVERTLGAPFTRVEVEDQLSVNIVRGAQKLTITADENVLERIEAVLEGETLRLRMTNEMGVLPTFAHVELSAERLTALEVRDASQVSAEATRAAEWRLSVAGGSTCVLTELAADRFFLELSGESQVDVSGVAGLVDLEVLNRSRANTDGVNATDARVDVSGDSVVNVRASRSIELNSSGDSRVVISGDPAERQINADKGSQIDFLSGQ